MKHSMKTITGMLSLFILVAFAQVSVAQNTEPTMTPEQIAKKEAQMARKAERTAVREQAKLERDALKARMDAIKENAELSEEEKENLLAEVRLERKAARNAAHEQAILERDALKARIEAIKANTEISEEEKENLLAEVREERRALRDRMPNRKPVEKKRRGDHEGKKKNGKANMKDGAGHKMKKVEDKTFNGEVDQKRIEKSLQQLEKVEKKLTKSLDKNKISQSDYDTRMAELTEIKSRLEGVLTKK